MTSWKVTSWKGRDYFELDCQVWTAGSASSSSVSDGRLVLSVPALGESIGTYGGFPVVAEPIARLGSSTPECPTGRFQNLEWEEAS